VGPACHKWHTHRHSQGCGQGTCHGCALPRPAASLRPVGTDQGSRVI
jgi:hypothetical protein